MRHARYKRRGWRGRGAAPPAARATLANAVGTLLLCADHLEQVQGNHAASASTIDLRLSHQRRLGDVAAEGAASGVLHPASDAEVAAFAARSGGGGGGSGGRGGRHNTAQWRRLRRVADPIVPDAGAPPVSADAAAALEGIAKGDLALVQGSTRVLVVRALHGAQPSAGAHDKLVGSVRGPGASLTVDAGHPLLLSDIGRAVTRKDFVLLPPGARAAVQASMAQSIAAAGVGAAGAGAAAAAGAGGGAAAAAAAAPVAAAGAAAPGAQAPRQQRPAVAADAAARVVRARALAGAHAVQAVRALGATLPPSPTQNVEERTRATRLVHDVGMAPTPPLAPPPALLRTAASAVDKTMRIPDYRRVFIGGGRETAGRTECLHHAAPETVGADGDNLVRVALNSAELALVQRVMALPLFRNKFMGGDFFAQPVFVDSPTAGAPARLFPSAAYKKRVVAETISSALVEGNAAEERAAAAAAAAAAHPAAARARAAGLRASSARAGAGAGAGGGAGAAASVSAAAVSSSVASPGDADDDGDGRDDAAIAARVEVYRHERAPGARRVKLSAAAAALVAEARAAAGEDHAAALSATAAGAALLRRTASAAASGRR